MRDLIETSHESPRVPWNKGKLIGPNPSQAQARLVDADERGPVRGLTG
jgi:hypothetical protein